MKTALKKLRQTWNGVLPASVLENIDYSIVLFSTLSPCSPLPPAETVATMNIKLEPPEDEPSMSIDASDQQPVKSEPISRSPSPSNTISDMLLNHVKSEVFELSSLASSSRACNAVLKTEDSFENSCESAEKMETDSSIEMK